MSEALDRDTAHHCHADRCRVAVPPARFMCRRHWFMVPKRLRDLIWELYEPGQEITKTPSREYIDAANEAIDAVKTFEAGGPNV